MIKMLNDKVALITGANGGIGRRIVEVFLETGAKVVANFRTDSSNLETLRETFGENLFTIQGDVSKSEDVKNIFLKAKEKYGRIDILVNNAGILKDNLLMMVREEEWGNIIDTNLKGTFLCMQQAAKIMMKQGGGSIINISSIVGLNGNAGQCAYSSSKAGVIGLTKSASKELGQFKIRVNAIAPGVIQTNMIKNLKQEVIENFIKNTSLKRIGTPEDVAKVALFLASEQSDFITGHIISVDGGLVL